MYVHAKVGVGVGSGAAVIKKDSADIASLQVANRKPKRKKGRRRRICLSSSIQKQVDGHAIYATQDIRILVQPLAVSDQSVTPIAFLHLSRHCGTRGFYGMPKMRC